jgi:hypothetical protein
MKSSFINSRIYQIAPEKAMQFTIEKIGQSIKNGSKYMPLRNWAAGCVLPAPRKDFLAQLYLLWNAFLTRWRYVKDPFGTELLTAGPAAIMQLALGFGGGMDGKGSGGGDCDCATIAFGALARSIGFDVRICTTAKPFLPMSHVFCQCFVPKFGWITTDPVLLPKKNIGSMPSFGRMMVFNLNGQLLFKVNRQRQGAFPPRVVRSRNHGFTWRK